MTTITKPIADERALTAVKDDVRAHGGLLAPLDGDPPPPLFAAVELSLVYEERELLRVGAQLVQLTPDGGAALIVDESDRPALLGLSLTAHVPAASGNEPLWSRVAAMSKAEKIKLAKYGNADARRQILKDPDPMLHLQVLANPGINAQEVASLIKSGAASVAFVRGVLERAELASNLTVMEALVDSPKTPVFDAVKMVPKVSLDTAKRIAKTGKARPPVVTAAKKRVTRP